MFTILSPDLFHLLPFHIEINTEKAKRCTGHCVVCSSPRPLPDAVGPRPLCFLGLEPRQVFVSCLSTAYLPSALQASWRQLFLLLTLQEQVLTSGAGTLGSPNPSSVLFNEWKTPIPLTLAENKVSPSLLELSPFHHTNLPHTHQHGNKTTSCFFQCSRYPVKQVWWWVTLGWRRIFCPFCLSVQVAFIWKGSGRSNCHTNKLM